jgi:hypothetical protein
LIKKMLIAYFRQFIHSTKRCGETQAKHECSFYFVSVNREK